MLHEIMRTATGHPWNRNIYQYNLAIFRQPVSLYNLTRLVVLKQLFLANHRENLNCFTTTVDEMDIINENFEWVFHRMAVGIYNMVGSHNFHIFKLVIPRIKVDNYDFVMEAGRLYESYSIRIRGGALNGFLRNEFHYLKLGLFEYYLEQLAIKKSNNYPKIRFLTLERRSVFRHRFQNIFYVLACDIYMYVENCSSVLNYLISKTKMNNIVPAFQDPNVFDPSTMVSAYFLRTAIMYFRNTTECTHEMGPLACFFLTEQRFRFLKGLAEQLKRKMYRNYFENCLLD